MRAPPTHRPGRQTALLLIDVINAFDFPGATQLFRLAMPAAKHIADLRRRCRAAVIPTIYVNDNFGRWTSDFRTTIARCSRHPTRGAIARLMRPTAGDYFVLKPRHSGFYLTPLELLLRDLGVRRLLLTGFAADMCVLHTAVDAHMRHFDLTVVSDCVAAESEDLGRFALREMKRSFGARIVPSTRLRLPRRSGSG